jgi:hypothetical protein
MSTVLKGLNSWELTRDKDGHKDYTAKWLIESDTKLDGPNNVMYTPGLPSVGSTWAIGNDADLWAFCWPNARVTPLLTGEPNRWWFLEQTFSTRPLNRCQDTEIENPLAEPPRVSGGFSKYTRESHIDRHGRIIQSSSLEPLTGAAVEIDDNRPTVSIEINTAVLPLGTFCSMIDHVNDAYLWGLEPRCVKLSNISWTRKLYGVCTFYYTIGYEFEIKFDTWDRSEADQGTMVLAPGLNPTATDAETGKENRYVPAKFVLYEDAHGGNSRVMLNGLGQAITTTDDEFTFKIEHYNEANLLLLGIPTSF